MSYKKEFSSTFDLGFNIDDLPIKLVDKSYQNDICPSFYFNINDQFFILWTDYKNKEEREEPESKRYTLVFGVNEGDNQHKEIYVDFNKEDILSTDNFLDIKKLILELNVY